MLAFEAAHLAKSHLSCSFSFARHVCNGIAHKLAKKSFNSVFYALFV